MKALEVYRDQISPIFVIPKEYLEPIRVQVPKLIEEVFREGIEQEKIEEVDELIDKLRDYIDTLPVFRNVKDSVTSGLTAFSSRNFRSAFITLLNAVEGVVREMFVMQGLGGANEELPTMAEKLRSEKWIRAPTENLIKSLDREKADHALYGEHSDFPETTSRLVILCLLKIARDYVYFKVLRRCLTEITKNPTYSRFRIGELLSLMHDRRKLHVERTFRDGRIFLIITLFSRDVFEFESTGPYWNTVKLLSSKSSARARR